MLKRPIILTATFYLISVLFVIRPSGWLLLFQAAAGIAVVWAWMRPAGLSKKH